MKLHEFTDRLYAMGDIEQKEKRRILTEGDTSGWGSYEPQHPVVAKCKLEPYKNWYVTLKNVEVYPEDCEIFTRDIEEAYVFISDYWENELQEILDEYTVGYTTDDFVPIWYDSTLEPYLDKNRKNESLTEARNPENDEVNAAIRRYLASEKDYIPKKDKDLFDKYGIVPGKLGRGKNKEKYMDGPNGDMAVDGIDYHPDYDIANSITKQKLDNRDKEVSTKDMMSWYDLFGDGPKVSDNDTSKMSSNQFKSLQPYAQEKELIRDTRRRKNRALQDEEERIKAAKEETERRFKYADEDKEKAMNSVRAKRAARKNESLNLNESKQGLIDHLYEIINHAGITNEEIVDMLLGFMDESQLVEVIDELKLMCDIDDEDIM